MSARRPTIVGVLLLFLFCLPFPVFSRSMSFTVNKTSLYGDEELHIMATHSGFIDGETVYIKGAFCQENSTNYFGMTKNNDSWIKNGEETTTQRQIIVGQWDNTLTVRSDFSDSGFNGEGEYKLRIGYYYTTSPGKLSSVNWASNSATILLNHPNPTSTNTPIPTVDTTPTLTPTLTPIPTKIPTPSCTVQPTSFVQILSQVTALGGMASTGAVLGQEDEHKNNASASMDILSQKRPYITALLLVSIGLAFLAAVSVIKIRYTKKV